LSRCFVTFNILDCSLISSVLRPNVFLNTVIHIFPANDDPVFNSSNVLIPFIVYYNSKYSLQVQGKNYMNYFKMQDIFL
jgi:hypothetical protein